MPCSLYTQSVSDQSAMTSFYFGFTPQQWRAIYHSCESQWLSKHNVHPPIYPSIYWLIDCYDIAPFVKKKRCGMTSMSHAPSNVHCFLIQDFSDLTRLWDKILYLQAIFPWSSIFSKTHSVVKISPDMPGSFRATKGPPTVLSDSVNYLTMSNKKIIPLNYLKY